MNSENRLSSQEPVTEGFELSLRRPRLATRRCFLVASLACALTVGYFLRRDYAWQIMLLLRVVPPARTGCMEWAQQRGGRSLAQPSRPQLRFGILMVFDEAMRHNEMTRLSVRNKRAYAARHGYEVVVADPLLLDRSRPPAWSKFLALRQHLERFDFLMFMDVDTLVMNDEVKLEELVVSEVATRAGGADREAKDLFISEDWNGVNTGVFILRNSSWSRWFLQEAWGSKGSEQEWMAHNTRARSGRKYPFEYEQRAVHYLLQTQKWRERGLPAYRPNRQESWAGRGAKDPWEHISLLPQCALNSYMLYPRLAPLLGFDAPEYYTAAQWVPGDFAVHMAGHKGSNKIELFKYCHHLAQTGGSAGKERDLGNQKRGRRALRAPLSRRNGGQSFNPTKRRLRAG